MNNVLSLQLAGERARKPRGGSNGQAQTTQLHGQSASNQRLFERLEAENARLRGRVVDLMLQIQALRDGASYGRVLINSADRWLMSALPPKDGVIGQQLIHKLPADYPIFEGKADNIRSF